MSGKKKKFHSIGANNAIHQIIFLKTSDTSFLKNLGVNLSWLFVFVFFDSVDAIH